MVHGGVAWAWHVGAMRGLSIHNNTNNGNIASRNFTSQDPKGVFYDDYMLVQNNLADLIFLDLIPG